VVAFGFPIRFDYIDPIERAVTSHPHRRRGDAQQQRQERQEVEQAAAHRRHSTAAQQKAADTECAAGDTPRCSKPVGGLCDGSCVNSGNRAVTGVRAAP
jgi:hypothetical protein